MFDVHKIRSDFPILSRQVNGKPLVYLDNAASAQKPRVVLEAIQKAYGEEYANVHRGVHLLSQIATQNYEKAREKIKKYLGASSTEEIIFVRGATEGINLVAQCLARTTFNPGDEILISAMEHHSNIVPWQMVCEQAGLKLVVAPMNHKGELELDQFQSLISQKTKLVAIAQVSNALGTINPLPEIIRYVREKSDAKILIDGAQSLPHARVNVTTLDCDFFVFSGHKLFGPTGIGVLYGKKKILGSMPPYQGGGDMISQVTFEKTTYNVLPYKFEAGTPHIVGVIGLGAAIDYLETLDWEAIHQHERYLLDYATGKLTEIEGVRLVGTASHKAAVVSFTLGDIHPHDIATILDSEGIAVRAGHHCAQPVMDFFKIPATTRASFAFYNTLEEVDVLVKGIHRVLKIFG